MVEETISVDQIDLRKKIVEERKKIIGPLYELAVDTFSDLSNSLEDILIELIKGKNWEISPDLVNLLWILNNLRVKYGEKIDYEKRRDYVFKGVPKKTQDYFTEQLKQFYQVRFMAEIQSLGVDMNVLEPLYYYLNGYTAEDPYFGPQRDIQEILFDTTFSEMREELDTFPKRYSDKLEEIVGSSEKIEVNFRKRLETAMRIGSLILSDAQEACGEFYDDLFSVLQYKGKWIAAHIEGELSAPFNLDDIPKELLGYIPFLHRQDMRKFVSTLGESLEKAHNYLLNSVSLIRKEPWKYIHGGTLQSTVSELAKSEPDMDIIKGRYEAINHPVRFAISYFGKSFFKEN